MNYGGCERPRPVFSLSVSLKHGGLTVSAGIKHILLIDAPKS